MNDGFAFGYSRDADVQEAADDGAEDENDKADIEIWHQMIGPFLPERSTSSTAAEDLRRAATKDHHGGSFRIVSR